jgi:hypothetical protein
MVAADLDLLPQGDESRNLRSSAAIVYLLLKSFQWPNPHSRSD